MWTLKYICIQLISQNIGYKHQWQQGPTYISYHSSHTHTHTHTHTHAHTHTHTHTHTHVCIQKQTAYKIKSINLYFHSQISIHPDRLEGETDQREKEKEPAVS